MKPKLTDGLTLALTVLLSLVACCVYYQYFDPAQLDRPWFYAGDIPLTQSYAKVAAEGQAWPWQPRTG